MMAVVSCTTTRPFLVGCVGCMDMPEEEEFNLRQIKGGCQSEFIYTNTVLHVCMFGQNIFCLVLIKSCVMESCACTCILTKRFHLILQSLYFWSMGTLCVCVCMCACTCVGVCTSVCVCVCVCVCAVFPRHAAGVTRWSEHRRPCGHQDSQREMDTAVWNLKSTGNLNNNSNSKNPQVIFFLMAASDEQCRNWSH